MPFPNVVDYLYDPLPAEGWTRILELHPGIGPLSCSFSCENIADLAPNFEALSYVWGSNAPETTITIKCNGRSLSIGPNLSSALNHIRHEQIPRRLWVDALCINQKDTHERSLQVQHMSEIYANAQGVLVWIGEDQHHEAEECFDLIRKTTAYLIGEFMRYSSVEEIPPIPYHELIDANVPKWDMVRRMMESAWFNRVWVLQEIGLARSAIIQYGKATMKWSQLIELLLFVSYRADIAMRIGHVKAGLIWDLFDGIWCSFGNETTWRNELPLTRSLNKVGGVQNLIDVLAVTRPYQATDQRDRIYAFLGHPLAAGNSKKEDATEQLTQTMEGGTRRTLNRRTSSGLMPADYDKSLDEVYLETATHVLKTDENPWTVLSSVDHKPNSPSLSGQRPSWVPRWDEGWYTYWLGYPTMWYRAGGKTSVPFEATVSETGALLMAQGLVLDTIIWTSRAFTDEELTLEQQSIRSPVLELWDQLQGHTLANIYGQSIQDHEFAFGLTTAAGRAADDGPAEEDPGLQRSVYQEYKDLIGWGKAPHDESTARRPGLHREVSETTIQVHARAYVANQRRALRNRRFYLTSSGYIGVVHHSVEAGDVCAVLQGANMPFVLRRTPSVHGTGDVSNHYRLIGESYIQGVMRGEIFDKQDNGSHGQGSINVQEKFTIH
ncbi:MAG: hypothetical protein Q9218_003058 [Villophora microphyllina]